MDKQTEKSRQKNTTTQQTPRPEQPKKQHIIHIKGISGGTGKTTIAILSALLARDQGKNTLIIDYEPNKPAIRQLLQQDVKPLTLKETTIEYIDQALFIRAELKEIKQDQQKPKRKQPRFHVLQFDTNDVVTEEADIAKVTEEARKWDELLTKYDTIIVDETSALIGHQFQQNKRTTSIDLHESTLWILTPRVREINRWKEYKEQWRNTQKKTKEWIIINDIWGIRSRKARTYPSNEEKKEHSLSQWILKEAAELGVPTHWIDYDPIIEIFMLNAFMGHSSSLYEWRNTTIYHQLKPVIREILSTCEEKT